MTLYLTDDIQHIIQSTHVVENLNLYIIAIMNAHPVMSYALLISLFIVMFLLFSSEFVLSPLNISFSVMMLYVIYFHQQMLISEIQYVRTFLIL